MSANHDASSFVKLLVPEGEFVCASYRPVGHISREGLDVNELVSNFNEA